MQASLSGKLVFTAFSSIDATLGLTSPVHSVVLAEQPFGSGCSGKVSGLITRSTSPALFDPVVCMYAPCW